MSISGLFLIGFLCLFGLSVNIEGSTEADIVFRAIQKNPDIRMSRISLQKDSLALASVRAQAGLQAVITGDRIVELHPDIRESLNGKDTTERKIRTSLGGNLSRSIPGGGSMNLGVTTEGAGTPDSGSMDFSTTTSLNYTQPLLKNAWANGEMDYQVNIQKNSLRISEEQFKAGLLDALSKIREGYWDLFSAEKTVEILETQVAYAQGSMDYEKRRFQLGQNSEMDTLTAALELLRAKENLMNAGYDAGTARKDLALALDTSAEELKITPDTAIVLSPLPSVPQMLESIQRQDANLNILEITRNSLALQVRKNRNALLPRLDVIAQVDHIQEGNQPFSGKTASTLDPWIGIRFTYDLLARSARVEEKSTAFSVESYRIEADRLIKSLALDVEKFVDAWAQDSARLSIRTAETAIAEKNYTAAVESYKLGAIDNLALLKAQNDLINARLNKLYSEINLKKLEIAVDKATANTLNRFGVGWK